jgi:hypothetical protein
MVGFKPDGLIKIRASKHRFAISSGTGLRLSEHHRICSMALRAVRSAYSSWRLRLLFC